MGTGRVRNKRDRDAISLFHLSWIGDNVGHDCVSRVELKRKIDMGKITYYFKRAVPLFIVGLLSLPSGAAYAHHGGKVHISPYRRLYVRIIDNSSIGSDGSFGSELSELDRYRFMSEAITTVFESKEYPVALKFVRFGKDIPPDENVLTISIYRWTLNRIGEYETRFFAKIKSRKGKVDLGSFTGRYIAVNLADREKVINNFKASAGKALEKLYPEIRVRTLPGKTRTLRDSYEIN